MDLMTISDLCREFGEPEHVVNHALKSHGPPPAARIGAARVWTRQQLDAVRSALRETAKRSTLEARKATITEGCEA